MALKTRVWLREGTEMACRQVDNSFVAFGSNGNWEGTEQARYTLVCEED